MLVLFLSAAPPINARVPDGQSQSTFGSKARGGGPKGESNGGYRHGLYTKEAAEEHRVVRGLLRQSRRALAALWSGRGNQ